MARPWLDVTTLPLGLNRPRDGGSDWADALQEGIDTILKLYFPTPGNPEVPFGTLYLPPGIYPIGKPLLIGLRSKPGQRPKDNMDRDICGPLLFTDPPGWKPFEFCHIDICGDNPGPGSLLGRESHASIILAKFDDRPAIVIQGARSVRLRNLIILGRNTWTIQPGRDPRDMRVHLDDASYKVGTPRDTRTSPYAGVCIDPFAPFLTALDERYPMLDELYDASYAVSSENCRRVMATSTGVAIEHCLIRGFVTGVVITPAGRQAPPVDTRTDVQPANAENIRIASTTIESTVSALAICQSQSRHLVLSDVTITGAKYAINTVDYGQGTGNMPSIFGARISGVRHLFNVSSVGSGFAVQGLFAQDFLTLGQLFGSSDFDGFVFDGCQFQFGEQPDGTPAQSAQLLNLSHTVFRGCTFERPYRDNDPLIFFNGKTLTFLGCRFQSDRPGAPLWVTQNPYHAAFRDCLLYDSQSESTPFGQQQQADRRLRVLPGSFYEVSDEEHPLWWASSVYPRIPLGQGDLVVGADGRGTFTFGPDAYGMFEYLADLLLPGDLVLSEVEFDEIGFPPARQVLIPSGRLMLGLVAPEEGDPQRPKITAAGAGQKLIHIVRVPAALRRPANTTKLVKMTAFISYFPTMHRGTVGDLEANSRAVTGVTLNAERDWRPGDRIRAPAPLDMMMPRRSNPYLRPGTYLRKVSAGAFELSAPARRGGAAVRLYDADMQAVQFRP